MLACQKPVVNLYGNHEQDWVTKHFHTLYVRQNVFLVTKTFQTPFLQLSFLKHNVHGKEQAFGDIDIQNLSK